MTGDLSNSLLSAHKSSDSGLRVHLHPLVLLTISDYITRHTLRNKRGLIVGALLGQQDGHEISLEHAFECDVVRGRGGHPILNKDWFRDRLQQYKDVHKSPVLELVGWFTVAPPTGPEAQHVPIQKQILKDYNETAVLLAFHPSGVLQGAAVGGKLPLTIYESVYESIGSDTQALGDDGKMEVEGQDVLQDSQLDLRFRELPYSVETGEAEMISVVCIARGGGSAIAVDGNTKNPKTQASQASVVESDSQQTIGQTKAAENSSILSAADEERLAFLMTRANAVKILHTRIQLLKSYLTNLPPCYLNTSSPSAELSNPPPSNQTEINHPILRSIQALISRLPLLMPAGPAVFEQERIAESSDVCIVSLLGKITRSVKETRETGRKFGIVDQIRQSANRRQGSNLVTADDLISLAPNEKSEAAFEYAV